MEISFRRRVLQIIDSHINEIEKEREKARAKPNWRTTKARWKTMVARTHLKELREEIKNIN